jgi:hypothetical protein
MIRGIRFILALAALLVTTEPIQAATVYHTSLSNASNEFWAYDTVANSWTQKNDFQTGSTLAVDTAGNVYAYSQDRTAILKYDPAGDLWNFHLAAPTLGGVYDDYSFFNLEITETGRFLLTGNGLTDLYYSDGGAWSSVALGFETNATGDYDPATGQYAVTPWNGTSPKLIDTQTFAITNFSGTGFGGEARRSGTILGGQYFMQSWDADIEAWNLSDPGAAPAILASTPSDVYWMTSAADRGNGYLYAADIWSGVFYRYDGNSWTRLADVGATTIDHSTIAFVADSLSIPEPASVALLSLGAVGLAIGALWRRRRTHG